MRPRDFDRKMSRKSRDFDNAVRVGAAAFAPRMSGGFAAMINRGQSGWPALNKEYKQRKQQQGMSTLKWVRSGRTRRALSQGPFSGEKKSETKKGAKFKASRKWLARVWAATFKPRKKGRKPRARDQERIFGRLNFGPGMARPLFEWRRSEIKEIEKAVAKETRKIVLEGLDR